MAKIKKWNNLKSNDIRVGQRLIIYRGGKAPATTSSTSTTKTTTAQTTSTAVSGGTTYTVRSGDALSKIAEKYGVTVTQLKQWNNLSSHNIRVGQKLIVSKSAAPVSTAAASSSQKSVSTVNPDAAYTEYIVKDGESLYLIAKKFPGVSAQNIMDFNGIGSNIKPGMKIKIPKL